MTIIYSKKISKYVGVPIAILYLKNAVTWMKGVVESLSFPISNFLLIISKDAYRRD